MNFIQMGKIIILNFIAVDAVKVAIIDQWSKTALDNCRKRNRINDSNRTLRI